MISTEKRHRIDMDIFDVVNTENVTELPYDINGLRHFWLGCDPQIMNSSKDGRPWQTWCTSNRSQHRGVRRRAWCEGSWSCPNPRQVQDTKAKVEKSLEQHGHCFDALCEFKKFCDQKDPLLVYRFNDERQNGDLMYVFKCLQFQAKLSLSMDRGETGLLNDQYCYADTTHKRCPGFKTLTLWVYHPLLRKLVKLATLECLTDDTDAFVQFWTLFNEVWKCCFFFNLPRQQIPSLDKKKDSATYTFSVVLMPHSILCIMYWKQIFHTCLIYPKRLKMVTLSVQKSP